MQIQKYRKAIRCVLSTDKKDHEIGDLVGISKNTVKKCRGIATQLGWTTDAVADMDDLSLSGFFQKTREQSNGKVMPDWSHIHKLMQKKHQILRQLWVEYREQYGCFAYSYSQFTHHYREYLSKVDITMRQVHLAGECVFVDYAGQTIPWFDMNSGQKQTAQIFVAVSGCSNYTFAYASASQKLPDWIEAHNRMFQFFGGVHQSVVPDNLKSAITKPGRDLLVNRTYQELADHYGVVIVPSRVRKPQDKSKAELGVKWVTHWITMPLLRRKYFSIAEINQALAELLKKLNQRSFKRMPGNRLERFHELDKPALNPLPEKPYEYGEWVAPQKVGPDYHIYVKGHAYSVPYRLVGDRVDAKFNNQTVSIYHLSKQVALHIRSHRQGEATTNPNHRPARHQAYASQTLEHHLKWAYHIGQHSAQLVKEQFHGRPDYSIVGRKACENLKLLAKAYGPERFEGACQRALEIQSPTLKSVKSILQSGLEVVGDLPPITPIPPHDNVRGADYFKDGEV